MDVRLYDTATDFGSVARWVYRRDPSAVHLRARLPFAGCAARPTGSCCPSSTVACAVGAAVQAGDAALLVSGLPPEMAKEAAAELSTGCAALPGVCGTPSTANGVRRAWSDAVDVETVETIGRTLYRLDDLALPKGVPGVGRLAAATDAELIVDWLDGFFAEAFGAASDRDARRRYLGEIIVRRRRLRAVVGGRCAGQRGSGARPRGGHVAHRAGVHAARGTGARNSAQRPPRRRCSAHAGAGPGTWCCSPTSPTRVRTESTGAWASCRSPRTSSTPSRRDD